MKRPPEGCRTFRITAMFSGICGTRAFGFAQKTTSVVSIGTNTRIPGTRAEVSRKLSGNAEERKSGGGTASLLRLPQATLESLSDRL